MPNLPHGFNEAQHKFENTDIDDIDDPDLLDAFEACTDLEEKFELLNKVKDEAETVLRKTL
jgi:hypothetical protein